MFPTSQEKRDFEKILTSLRNSPEQRRLIEEKQLAVSLKNWAAAAGVLAFPIAAIAAAMFGPAPLWLLLPSLLPAALCLYAAIKLDHRLRLLAKDQDRRYFLQSIRAASTLRELNEAGLFAYLTTRTGDEELDDMEKEATRLIAAMSDRSDWYERYQHSNPFG